MVEACGRSLWPNSTCNTGLFGCIKNKPGSFNHSLSINITSEVASMKKAIKINVNGTAQNHEVEPRMLLVHYLRDVLGLTGTHVGCETSLCGACTVLVDGQSVKSCTVFAVQADGAEVTTIEGMGSEGRLSAVREGFWEKHGLQCAHCTPGMTMAAAQILGRTPSPPQEKKGGDSAQGF